MRGHVRESSEINQQRMKSIAGINLMLFCIKAIHKSVTYGGFAITRHDLMTEDYQCDRYRQLVILELRH